MSTLKWVRTYLYRREGMHGLFYEYFEKGNNVLVHEGGDSRAVL